MNSVAFKILNKLFMTGDKHSYRLLLTTTLPSLRIVLSEFFIAVHVFASYERFRVVCPSGWWCVYSCRKATKIFKRNWFKQSSKSFSFAVNQVFERFASSLLFCSLLNDFVYIFLELKLFWVTCCVKAHASGPGFRWKYRAGNLELGL